MSLNKWGEHGPFSHGLVSKFKGSGSLSYIAAKYGAILQTLKHFTFKYLLYLLSKIISLRIQVHNAN